jgi:hypothetical protein
MLRRRRVPAWRKADKHRSDLCAEALHLMVRANGFGTILLRLDLPVVIWISGIPSFKHSAASAIPCTMSTTMPSKSEAEIMGRIRKIAAFTAAGIYAKALVVRASRTSAPILAMSLASDLINCPAYA